MKFLFLVVSLLTLLTNSAHASTSSEPELNSTSQAYSKKYTLVPVLGENGGISLEVITIDSSNESGLSRSPVLLSGFSVMAPVDGNVILMPIPPIGNLFSTRSK
jgi:hypothetical protein